MVNELTKLYNTLLTVETKGENSVTMADCLRYLKSLIVTEQRKAEEAAKATTNAPEVLPEE